MAAYALAVWPPVAGAGPSFPPPPLPRKLSRDQAQALLLAVRDAVAVGCLHNILFLDNLEIEHVFPLDE